MTTVPQPLIHEILDAGRVRDDAGREYPLHSHIPLEYAGALYRTVLELRPATAIEIGMAYGISSLTILTALRDAGGAGRLISIDPRQSTAWNGVGLAHVRRAGLADRHQLIEQFDYLALPELLARGETIQFAYIDGWHTFDYVLLDFFYIDRMLAAGGIVTFNDAGWRAIHRVTRFVRTHRRYREIDVGLRRDYRGRNPLTSLARRLARMSHADRYFKKLEAWEPRWDFYAPF